MSDTETEPRYFDDTEDAPVDTGKMTEQEFSDYLDQKFPNRHDPVPAPAPAPASQPASQGPPTTPPGVRVAQAQLDALNQEITRLEEEAAAAAPEGLSAGGGDAAMLATLPLRAKAEDLRRQAFRIEQQIEHDIVGLDENVLGLMHEDLVLELDELQKTINNAPAEAMRLPADRIRVARAIRQQDALLAKAAAVKREKDLQRDLKAYDRARAADIARLTEQRLEEQRDRRLAEKLEQARIDEARPDGGLPPDLESWIRREFVKDNPITDAQREQVYAAVAAEYDETIRKGVLDSLIPLLGG